MSDNNYKKSPAQHRQSAGLGVQRVLPLLAAMALAACGGGSGNQTNPSDQTLQAAEQPTKRALAAAPASTGGVLINEVVAGNWHGALDEDGDAEDWIELYNPASTAVDLSGYGLSNKATTPFQWAFPAGTTIAAKGYMVVWLSKKDRKAAGAPLHASFNLDSGADPVILTASNATAAGITVDTATPPLLRADQAWCRMPSGVATAPFMVCAVPTRGAANAGTADATVLAKPVLSLASGFYAAAQSVAITAAAGATLRYTTDGSEPTATSAAYTAPLNITTPTVLRVAAFASGAAPSLVETGNYVVDAALAPRYAGLKAVMVAMAPGDLTAFQANDKTRDFRASFEMITGGTTSVFKMDAQGSAAGQLGSGDSPQRSMNIKAGDEFGAKSFPGVLWPDKPGIKSSKKLRLRNGSNDWAGTHLRDQLSQKISADGPNLVSASTSVAMFINGKYYGLMDLREREEESLPASNLGIDKDFVDYLYDPLLGAQEIKNGGAAALANYKAMNDYVTGNDMSVPANYARAKTLLNPESLAWDWAMHMFHANYDWPGRNVHVWRSPEVDGRWTWHAHDMDFAFGRYTGVGYNMNPSFSAAGSGVINALLRNAEFRNLYLNTVADQLNTMSPAAMNATLDGMASEMRPYIADYYAKNGMGPASNWETRLTGLRTWFAQREAIYDGHNRTQFNLAARQPISVAVNDLAMGSVKVNSVETQKAMTAAAPTWRGNYYPGVPITLEAVPRPGYAFVGWQGASTASTLRISQTLVAGASSTSPPAAAVACANENQTCSLPAGATATVWYGAGTSWASLTGVSGSVACDNATFGDPAVGTGKSCRYQVGAGAAAGAAVQLTAVFAATGAPAAPVLQAIAAQSWRTGDLVALTVAATDPGGYAVTYAAKTLPKGLNINPATGVIYGRISTPGTYTSTLTATNGVAAGTISLVWTVTDRPGTGLLGTSADSGTGTPPANVAPVATLTAPLGNASLAQGTAITVAATAVDTDGSIARVEFYDGATLIGTATAAPFSINWANASTGAHSLSARAVDNLGAVGNSAPVAITVVANVPTPTPPAGAVACGAENQTCTLPAGSTATVWYGAAGGWAQRTGVTGSIACDNATFGDPLVGTGKACLYLVTSAPQGNAAPTVALSAPAANAQSVQGAVIPVAASAADSDGSVAQVDFYDGATLIASDTTAPYSVAWANAAVGVHTLTARAVDNAGATTTSTAVQITVTAAPPTVPPGTGTGLLARYFANNNLAGNPVLQRTEAVNFNWGLAAPAAGVPADNFSVRWLGQLEAPVAGAYQLQTNSDDGVRVWLNGQLVINNWTAHAATLNTSAVVNLAAGQRVAIVVEYQELTGYAVLQLQWKTPTDTGFAAVPANRLYPAAASTGTGLRGQYFANSNFSGNAALVRTELPALNVGLFSAPVSGLSTNGWAVRWDGTLAATTTGSHELRTTIRSDDGVRVWVNNVLVIDNWGTPAGTSRSAVVQLAANVAVPVRVEFVDRTSAAQLALDWKLPGATAFQVLPVAVLSPP